MNLRKHASSARPGLLAAAAGLALAGLASDATAASVVTLSLQVNQAAHTWSAYGTISDPASSGFDDLQFDVTTSGSILLGPVGSGGNKLPKGNFNSTDALGSISTNSGFFNFRANSLNAAKTDATFGGGQDVVYLSDASVGGSTSNDNLVKGMGNPGVSAGGNGDTLASWGDPALLATGTYTGASGSITVSGLTQNFAILSVPYAVPDSQTAGQFDIQAHKPDAIIPQTVAIAAPEPAGLGLLAVASLGVLRRRRKV